ncbi:MAG: SDR family oxidoreductase [Acidobacteria bacterium]|nr:SDR family oxidoreductase [Acidobacteriota bacterium]
MSLFPLLFGKEGLNSCLERIQLISGDVRRLRAEVLDGVDAVINLAGLSNDPTANFNPEANHAVNTLAAIQLARMCTEAGVRRYIQASSCSVYYTEVPIDIRYTEDTPVMPQAHYSKSKRAAEQGLLSLVSDSFCPVILRKGTVYGWSPRMRYDLVVNTLTKDAFQHRLLTIHAGGKMWRPMIHIDDAVDAYLMALEAPEDTVRGQIFNILLDNYRVIDMAKMIRGHLERAQGVKIDLNIQSVGVSRSYRCDGDKARRVLGFNPARMVQESVSPIWEHLESGIDPNEPRFYNITWIELLCDMEKRLTEMGGHVF